VEQEQSNRVDVLICMPSYRGMVHEFTQRCLDALVQYTKSRGYTLALTRPSGALIHKSRNHAIEVALGDVPAKWVMFIDSDMAFDADALERLLKRGRDIVSGLCVKRTPPYAPIPRTFDREREVFVPLSGLDKGGMRDDAEMLGTGFLLVNTDVFRKLEPPWFACPPYKDQTMGEDFYFCVKAAEAGYKLWTDADLIIGHLGDYPFTIHDFVEGEAQKAQMEAQKKESGLIVCSK
jgi:hypothetical protein